MKSQILEIGRIIKENRKDESELLTSIFALADSVTFLKGKNIIHGRITYIPEAWACRGNCTQFGVLNTKTNKKYRVTFYDILQGAEAALASIKE